MPCFLGRIDHLSPWAKSVTVNVDPSLQSPKSKGFIGRPRVPSQEGTDHSSGRGQGLQPGLQRPRPSVLVGERLGWRNRGREGQGVQSELNKSLPITQQLHPSLLVFFHLTRARSFGWLALKSSLLVADP